ncbi:MAG: hypothetical protein BRC58_06455 [Cyanobacteria bacterium QS_8_64_29]|nr:MAG: hypothetical protein BRC58_06455 [Cyanobacteria bacterium QS_8_64_29]
MHWQNLSGTWVLLPPTPIGIIHFIGGAFIGSAPQLTYRWLLEQLAQAGFAVIATPFDSGFDHKALARNSFNRFEGVLQRLQASGAIRQRYLPVYGLGHSVGCKLHLLGGSLFGPERAGNMLLAYNNFPVRRAVPFGDRFNWTSALDLEFDPSPKQTRELIAQNYAIRRNLLVAFDNDTLDQSRELVPMLQAQFPELVVRQQLPGNHLTPLTQELNWDAGEAFSPLDALGQWLKQRLDRDLKQLRCELLSWLNPAAFASAPR